MSEGPFPAADSPPPPVGSDSGDRKHWTDLLLAQLGEAAALRAQARAHPETSGARMALRAWQSARLAKTHADLLTQPQFAPAARFFLEDLYGAKDCTARDTEVARIVPTLVKVLPPSGIHALALAMRMDALSEALDAALVAALQAEAGDSPISAARYARAYRATSTEEQRHEQIRLVGEIGQLMVGLTRKPLLGLAIRAFRKPAHVAGLGELHDFLDRGFRAFSHMDDPNEFLRRVTAREQQVMEALFAGSSDVLEDCPQDG